MTVSRTRRYLETLAPRPALFAAEKVLASHCVDPIKVREVARVQKLSEISRVNARVVDSTRLTNTDMLRDDCELGVRLWVLEEGVDVESVYPGVARDLGDGIMGIYPPDLLDWHLKNHSEQLEDFAHMDTVRVPVKTVQGLEEAKIPTRRASALSRLIKNPQTLVYFVVFIYSSLRALPVMFVKEFEGSILLLWSIDVITAIPYTWGVLAMVLAKKAWVRIVGALTTIATFVAPYVYFWTHGDFYPWYVTVIVAFLIITGIAVEIVRYMQEKTLEKRYSQAVESVAPSA